MRKNFVALGLVIAGAGLCSALSANPAPGRPSVDQNEACANMIPASLRAQVAHDFPGFRFIRVDDYLPEDITSESQYHHGSKCISAASGDYFGDRKMSFAFLLLNSKGDVVVAVARPLTNQGWETTRIVDFNVSEDFQRGAKFNYYLNTLDSGEYSDMAEEAGDSTPEPGRVETIKSDHPGIVYGAIESTGIAYFYSKGKWIHTYVAD